MVTVVFAHLRRSRKALAAALKPFPEGCGGQRAMVSRAWKHSDEKVGLDFRTQVYNGPIRAGTMESGKGRRTWKRQRSLR